MRPESPATVHERFLTTVRRALDKPLDDCPSAVPARPCERVRRNEES